MTEQQPETPIGPHAWAEHYNQQRASIRHLLDRASRGVLTPAEAELLRQQVEAEQHIVEQGQRQQLGDREAISYWTHQARLARDYSAYDDRARTAAVLQAQRWAARARAAEAAIERVRALHQPIRGLGYASDEDAPKGYSVIEQACSTCGTHDEYAIRWPCETTEALVHPDVTRLLPTPRPDLRGQILEAICTWADHTSSDAGAAADAVLAVITRHHATTGPALEPPKES